MYMYNKPGIWRWEAWGGGGVLIYHSASITFFYTWVNEAL